MSGFEPDHPEGEIAMKNLATVQMASMRGDAEAELLNGLRLVFPEVESSQVIQLSVQPPAWIEILSDVVTWKAVFKVAAAAYLSTLAKEAAKSTWAARIKAMKSAAKAADGAADSISLMFKAIYQATLRENRPIGVRLSVASPFGEISVTPAVNDERSFLERAALFVAAQDAIQTAATHLHSTGHKSFAEVGCIISDDGLILRWNEFQSEYSLVRLQQQFDCDGNAIGEPQNW